jgi:hypothetical protein
MKRGGSFPAPASADNKEKKGNLEMTAKDDLAFEQFWLENQQFCQYENQKFIASEAYSAACWSKNEEIAKLNELIAENEAAFDHRWKADMRAIKMWQEAHPGNDLVWPDHASLCVWLMEQLDKLLKTTASDLTDN